MQTMNLQTLCLGFLVCLAFLCPCKADEAKEPPLKLTLRINGESFPLEYGQEVQLEGEFKNLKVSVHASKTRTFDYGGVSFDYPANLNWEADVENAFHKNWTLSGNDCSVMFFVIGVEGTNEEFVRNVVEQYGESNTEIKPITQKLGSQTLKGHRLIVELAGNKLVQDVLSVPSPAGQTRLLVLQDVAPERTPDLEEPKQILELLKATFKIEPKP